MIHVRRTLAALAACVALGIGPAQAEAVWIGHYVPSIQEPIVVDIEAAGSPTVSRTIAYGDAVRLDIDLPRSVRLTARRSSGAVVVETTALLSDADHSIAFAGVLGTRDADRQAPVLDFYIAEEAPRAVGPEQFSFRKGNFMVGPNAPASPLITTSGREGGFGGVSVEFGAGYRRTSTTASSGNFGFSTYANALCRAAVYPRAPTPGMTQQERDALLANPISQLEFQCLPGRLYRVVAIGDGAQSPYSLRVVDVNATEVRPYASPTPAMNGMWTIEGEPGTGISFAIETIHRDRSTLRGLLYGYVDGKPRWRFLESPTAAVLPAQMTVDVAEYVGGSPGGDQAAVAIVRDRIQLTFYACDRASMFVLQPRRIGLRGDQPTNYELVRMLPARSCDAATNGEPGATP